MSEVVHWFRILSSPQDIESSHEGKCRREGRGGGKGKRETGLTGMFVYTAKLVLKDLIFQG